jgi:hypothetical protein
LLGEVNLRDENQLLALMAPSILKAYEHGRRTGIAEPVVVVFLDEEVERPTDEQQEVTVNGETYLANAIESEPSPTEQRVQSAGGTLVARSETDGHVLGVAVVPRASWSATATDADGESDLPVTFGKVTVWMRRDPHDVDPLVRQFTRQQLAELRVRVARAAAEPAN